MPVAGALAKKRDYPLVIVQRAFRSKAADDPKRFHLLTTNPPSPKLLRAGKHEWRMCRMHLHYRVGRAVLCTPFRVETAARTE